MSDRSHHLFHHLAGFLVLVMMVLVSLLAKAAEPDIFTRAMDARSQGKVDEAYQLLEEAVNQGIRAHDAYYEMGLILMEKRDYYKAFRISGKAIKAFENYVEKNPQDEIAWFRLAYIHEVRSDAPGVSEWKEAREALEKALVLSPENSVYLLHLGYVYYRIGELDKAQQTFQAILDREPGNIEVRYYAALNYKKKGEPEKARTELEYILKNEPKESIVYRRAEDEFIKLGGNVE